MEIPLQLQSLYKHWEKHVEYGRWITDNGQAHVDKGFQPLALREIVNFISERMQVWQKKESGQNPPYTNDTILQKYRFCNIYRELDRQTIVFHKMLKQFENDLSLWLLNMLYCRLICNPETVLRTGFLSFDQEKNDQVYKKLKELPSPKYGTAYIFPVSIIMKTDWPTRELFFTKYLPTVIEKCAEVISKFKDESVVDALDQILPVFGFNMKFHWSEVFIDLAYQFPEYINLYKKFPIGPGSKPTMKMLNSGEEPELVCLELVDWGIDDNDICKSSFEYKGQPIHLSAENWEGVGCEFRKYTNLKNGGGRKRKYSPSPCLPDEAIA